MKWNPLKWPISCISGILVICFYCIFTFISLALYPWPYSPLTHWLSDLGNTRWDWIDFFYSRGEYNPHGGIFYNTGCILTGIALFPFLVGLYKWYTEEKWRKSLIIITQIVGFFSAYALIMIGIFSEDYVFEHQFWGNVFFILIFIELIVSSISLYTHPKYVRYFAYYGFISAFANLALLIIIFIPLYFPLIEWCTVFTALIWVGLNVYSTYKLEYTS